MCVVSFTSLRCPPQPPRCLVRLSSLPRPGSVTGRVLCALDALEAAEVPAFLQAGAHAGHFLSEGAGQPREKSLHLAGVDLQKPKKEGGNLGEFWKPYQATEQNLHCATTDRRLGGTKVSSSILVVPNGISFLTERNTLPRQMKKSLLTF